jgi:hypothetical protein
MNDIARQKLFALGLAETAIAGLSPTRKRSCATGRSVLISGRVVKFNSVWRWAPTILRPKLFVIADLARVISRAFSGGWAFSDVP